MSKKGFEREPKSLENDREGVPGTRPLALYPASRAVSFQDLARFDVLAITDDLAIPPSTGDLIRSKSAPQNHRNMKLTATVHCDDGALASADGVQQIGNCLKSHRNFAPISRLVITRVKTTPNAVVTKQR
jgi:hypothetical protein